MISSESFDEQMYLATVHSSLYVMILIFNIQMGAHSPPPVDFRPEKCFLLPKVKFPVRKFEIEVEIEIELGTKDAFGPAGVFTVLTHQLHSHHQPRYLHPHSEKQPPRPDAPRGTAPTRLQVKMVGVAALPALHHLVLKNIPDGVIREHHAVEQDEVGKERREHPEFQIEEQGREGRVAEVQVDRRPVGGVAERHQEGRDQPAPRGGGGFPAAARDHEHHPPERLSQITRRRDDAPAAADIFCDAPGVGENFYSPDLPARQPAGYGMGKFVYESRQEAYRF
eukprot:CAMPEP_0194331278 /NCGR_PEP_ID=MMETSP0171-20130528/55042_1 /TAXON_ID=218684 /ORGANISM="Corethron pennatum, Strain L29A3" /LENGTH=280 /DNA_ID=CAMNT_0039092699 /DNA_START=134 /DNA_END=976 /DNA_ORIENTATION=-